MLVGGAIAVCGVNDADQRPVNLRRIGVHPVHNGHLVRVQNDACANRIYAQQIDQRFDEREVDAQPLMIVQQLLENLVGFQRLLRPVDAMARGGVEYVCNGNDL